jgi:hypothetical protein
MNLFNFLKKNGEENFMKRRKRRSVIAITLMICLLMLSFSPYAFAAKDAEPDFELVSKETGFTVKELKNEWKLYLDIKDHVTFDDESGQVIFDSKAALKAGLTEDTVEKLQADFEIINESGILSCGGITDSQEYDWGYRIWFDSCDTNDLIGKMTTGAGLAALAAAVSALVFVPASVAFGVAAALLTIGAGYLTSLNSTGCGVRMDYYYDGSFYINRQYC